MHSTTIKLPIFILIFFLLELVYTEFAYSRKLSVGLKSGINIAKLYGRDAGGSGFGSKVGICGGLLTLYKINQLLTFQPELLYSPKGTQDKYDAYGIGEVTTSIIFDYIEIPILFKLSIPGRLNITPGIFAGPALAFRFKGILRQQSGDRSEEEKLNNLNVIDTGLTFGFSFDINVWNKLFMLDFRYNIGIYSVFKHQDEWSPKIKNRLISITAGYIF